MRDVKHALVLAPVLALAACSSGSSAAPSTAKTDYIAKAEVICAKANKEKDALKKPMSSAEFGTYVHSIVTIADETTTALLALTPPPADKKQLEAQILTPLSTQLVKARTFDADVSKAVKAHDDVALTKLLGNAPTKTVANLDFMRKYGFTGCVTLADTGS